MLNIIEQEKFVVVVRSESEDIATSIIKTAIEAGARVIELTMTTPNAINIAKKFSDNKEIKLGMGSVRTIEEVKQLKEIGIDFIVMAYFDPEVVKYAIESDVEIYPGIMTLSELVAAQKLGVKLFKLFPANNFKPSIIKDFSAPVKGIKIMPTGGVNLDNINEWLDNGAIACGIGSDLYKGATIEDCSMVTDYIMKLKKRVQ